MHGQVVLKYARGQPRGKQSSHLMFMYMLTVHSITGKADAITLTSTRRKRMSKQDRRNQVLFHLSYGSFNAQTS